MHPHQRVEMHQHRPPAERLNKQNGFVHEHNSMWLQGPASPQNGNLSESC